jgi:hypothetical protein
VTFIPSGRITARQVMNAERVLATRTALEKLQDTLS